MAPHSMALRHLWHHIAFPRCLDRTVPICQRSLSPAHAVSSCRLPLWCSGEIPPTWLILAALTVVCGSAPIRLYSIPVALSVSETFVFTSVILFGPAAGTLTVVLDAAVISFWSFKRGQKLFKIVFNVCALPLTIWIAAHLLFAVGTFNPLFGSQRRDLSSLRQLLGPLLLCTIVYFLLSSWIITFAIALEKRLASNNNLARELRLDLTELLWRSLSRRTHR